MKKNNENVYQQCRLISLATDAEQCAEREHLAIHRNQNQETRKTVAKNAVIS